MGVCLLPAQGFGREAAGAVLSLGPLWALHSLLRGRGLTAPTALPPKCTQSWVRSWQASGPGDQPGDRVWDTFADPTHTLHFVSVFPEAEHHLPHPQKPWGGSGCGTTQSPTRQCAYYPCPLPFSPHYQPWGRMEMAPALATPDPSSARQGCGPPYATFRPVPKCWSAWPPQSGKAELRGLAAPCAHTVKLCHDVSWLGRYLMAPHDYGVHESAQDRHTPTHPPSPATKALKTLLRKL